MVLPRLSGQRHAIAIIQGRSAQNCRFTRSSGRKAVSSGTVGAHPVAPAHTSQALIVHEALDRAAGHRNSFSVQLPPDLLYTVDAQVLLPNPVDLWLERIIALGTSAAQRGIALAGGVGPAR